MVATSFVCIFLNFCEVLYLCGKRFSECCTRGPRPMRVNSFMMTRTPLNGKENSAYNDHVPEKVKMTDNRNGEVGVESSAPPYSKLVS